MGDERIERLRRAAAQGDTDAQARHAYERWRRAGEQPTTPTWARVVRRAGAAAWTPAALSDARLRALEEDLAPLDEAEAGLAARAVRFVLAGEDDGLLRRLTAAPRSNLRVKTGWPLPRREPRAIFVPGDAPAPFLLRLGVVYDAAADVPRVVPALGWLEALLWEASAAAPNVESELDEPTRLSVAELEAALRLARRSPRWLVRLAAIDYEARPDGMSPMLPEVLASTRGFGEALTRSRRAVLRGLASRNALARVRALDLIARTGADPGPWAAAIVRAAAQDGAPGVRRAAGPLVRALGERARVIAAGSRSKKVKDAVAALLAEPGPRG